jgi:hypothetical protein
MDIEKAEAAARAKWIEWATRTAMRCKEYGDILVENGIPERLVIDMVKQYHQMLLGERRHINLGVLGVTLEGKE